MAKIALGYLADGFSGPTTLNERSEIAVQKLTNLYKKLTDLGHYVEVWITRSIVKYPEGQVPLYQVMREAVILGGIPESYVRVTDKPTYNALTDGGTFADYSAKHPMDEYIFVVPNFYIYFLLTYKAMRRHMGDGKNWERISVISACNWASPRVCLLYGVLTLITAVTSQNKWLWIKWFNLRAREKERRENGFVDTVTRKR